VPLDRIGRRKLHAALAAQRDRRDAFFCAADKRDARGHREAEVRGGKREVVDVERG
jgi:hypothetical protein